MTVFKEKCCMDESSKYVENKILTYAFSEAKIFYLYFLFTFIIHKGSTKYLLKYFIKIHILNKVQIKLQNFMCFRFFTLKE